MPLWATRLVRVAEVAVVVGRAIASVIRKGKARRQDRRARRRG